MRASYSTLIGTLIFVVVFAIGTQWMRYICLPWEVHTIKWECEVGLNFPLIASVLAGGVVGYLSQRWHFLLGAVVPIIGLVVLGLTPFLNGWYGEDVLYAVRKFLWFCVAPAACISWLVHMLLRDRKNAL